MVLLDLEAGATAEEAAELNRVPVEKVREWAGFYKLESLQRSALTIRDGQQAREQALDKLAAAHPEEFAALLDKERAWFEEYRSTPHGRESAAAEWRRSPQWKEILRKRAKAGKRRQ
jgi:hypothetical protein